MTPGAPAIVDTIEAVIGAPDPSSAVPLHEPLLGAREEETVRVCLESGFVSSVGEYVDRFECELAGYTGIPHAIAVSTGTAGLHLALVSAGVRPGDEVIVPGISFAATANAVAHCGALPHFVDVEPERLGMCPERLSHRLDTSVVRGHGGAVNGATGRRISAVVVVHIFGHPARVEELAAVCEAWGIPMIEDAAESLGSWVGAQHTGCFGFAGVLSFNGNKIVTTGGGGAILTRDQAVADRCKHLSTTARVPHRWIYDHDEVGYNYRLPNLNAALGVAQLTRLDDLLARKRKLAHRYENAFQRLGVPVIREPRDCRSNHWLNAIRIDDPATRDGVLELAWGRGLQLRRVWTPLHKLRAFARHPRGEMPVTERTGQEVVNLPSSPQLVEPEGQ